MKNKNLGILIGVIAIVLAFFLFKNWQKNTMPEVINTEVESIKLGYIIYPPLLSKRRFYRRAFRCFL